MSRRRSKVESSLNPHDLAFQESELAMKDAQLWSDLMQKAELSGVDIGDLLITLGTLTYGQASIIYVDLGGFSSVRAFRKLVGMQLDKINQRNK